IITSPSDDSGKRKEKPRTRRKGRKRALRGALLAAVMARLFRGGSLGDSKRESSGSSSLRLSSSSSSVAAAMSAADLLSPFGQIGVPLSDPELRETAYEIFVAACRTTGSKPLTYIPQSERTPPSAERSSSLSPSASSLQKSITSTAASKMKKALGLKSSSSSKKGSPGKDNSPSKPSKKPATVGDLMRVQMRISEQTDSRIRKGLLRTAAGQVTNFTDHSRSA
ncbi:hypothetical protein B296_00054652, partial [Ensete ventricosum]